MQDHYAELGLNETATEDEIKKTFRKLAMQYHPDKNPGDKSAEEKFKRINDAYSILGDSAKKAEYDQQRRYGGGHPGADSFHFGFGSNGFSNIDDMIRNFFRQNGFDHDPFGFNNPRRNRDLHMNIEITLEDAFTGKDMPINFNNNGHDVKIVLRIPRGIDSGTRMKFQGYGDRSIQGIPPGDLYVTVMVGRHSLFERDGPHLHAITEVDAFDAMLGSQKDIKCIDGGMISLTVPAGTQNGTVLRVRERGMPIGHNQSARGDLMVTVRVKIPTDLSPAHADDIRRIISERSH